MRDILFRGKRLDNGEWVQGVYYRQTEFYGDPQEKHFIITSSESLEYDQALEYFEVDPDTVGQCIGLEDKNAKPIFDGDIVHYLYEPGKGFWNSDQKSIIEWKSTGFFMRGIMGTNKYACSSGWLTTIPHGDGKCFEIIGNIHDNPELLKGGRAK